MSKLSIVTPVYNNWSFTNYYLNNLLKLSEDYELIIVDNASTDQTKDELLKLIELHNNLIYIRNEENKFFGYASNQGYTKASSDIVMFLNNDIKINDKNLKWLDDFVEKVTNSHNAIIGPTGGFVDPKKDYAFVYETCDPKMNVNYMSGWCLAAKKNVWNNLILENRNGPFDNITFKLYFEDTDLSFRATKNNIKFIIYKLPITHIGRQTSKNLNISKYYLESKNKFCKKWQSKKI